VSTKRDTGSGIPVQIPFHFTSQILLQGEIVHFIWPGEHVMGDFAVDFAVWLVKFLACSFAVIVVIKAVVRRKAARSSQKDSTQDQ
jgi:uncharacterized membrane protein (DUF106 family)